MFQIVLWYMCVCYEPYASSNLIVVLVENDGFCEI